MQRFRESGELTEGCKETVMRNHGLWLVGIIPDSCLQGQGIRPRAGTRRVPELEAVMGTAELVG